MNPNYLPVSDYAIVGDSRSAALVSRDGSIDWLCWPRFDSRSTFARLLDASKGGFFSIRPAGAFSARRRYLDQTNILETTFETGSGIVRLIDLMPALPEAQKRTMLLPFRQLLRRVEGVSGKVDMVATYEPRPNFARLCPNLERRAQNAIWCADGPEVWHLTSTCPLEVTGHSTAIGKCTLNAGERHDFALSYETHSPAVFPLVGSAANDVVESSVRFWRDWSSHLTYEGPYRDAVLRSALVLKLLSYAPSGGIIAAPTTSLPESVGGVRNWDYRYCWLRDASFTVGALYDCGFPSEGHAFVDWLLYATRLTHPSLQILYDVFGESRLPERELDHLEGYCGSRPVRVGNDARGQFQLDVYGEVLGAIEEYTDRGEELYRDTKRLARELADIVVRRWKEPDSGIWEKRSGLRQHTHAKVMAWAALDSAERLVRKGRIDGDVAVWRRTKDEIKQAVLTYGFNAKLNAFTSELLGEELDASLLAVARVGFLEAGDPRLLGTIDAIRRELEHDGLVHRYRSETTDDGLPPGEGAFLPCSFWLVESLAIANRPDDARALFENLLGRANDVGLWSEEAAVPSGQLIGNFPQALTHIGLLNAASRLEQPQAKRGEGSQAAQRTAARSAKPSSPGR